MPTLSENSIILRWGFVFCVYLPYSSPVLSEGVVLVFAALLSVYPLRLAIRTGDCQVDQRRADTGDARGKNKHDVQTEALEGNAAE